MNNFVYKLSEETKLIDSLSQSQLISREQLLEIKKLYNAGVPYHNFVHALKVAEGVLLLPTNIYSIVEIRSLFIAALFHDAGHSGTAQDLDEFRSLDLAFQGILDFEKKYDYQGIDFAIVRQAIIGTVFKNRANNTNQYAILLADLDIATIGMNFSEFLYYADFPFSVECAVKIDNWIQDYNFFKFLVSVDKNIFRTELVRSIFPEALKNIRKYTHLKKEKIGKIFSYWNENDIHYEEFENFYNKNS
ncbi:HD domain-containing protein [Candidatus Gracilibacteria bacterium]|nr:HD domain-containing protein [Candidatus Gracilibacteria bacterium]